MKQLTTKEPGRSAVFYFLLALAALQLFIALLTNGFALSQEEAMWHYIGRNWFRYGMVPYTGGVDNKSPLYMVIYGISDLLFGVNYWFPRVLGTLVQTLGIYFLYRIANHLAGKRAGLLAISFYGLSVLWHAADGRYVSYTETYKIIFSIIAFYYFITGTKNKHLWISGVCCALAIAFRLSAVFDTAALLILTGQRGLKHSLNFLLGFAIGTAVLMLSAILCGMHLPELYFYAFADNFGSGSISDHSFLWQCDQLLTMFCYSEIILFYPLIMLYVFTKRKLDWVMIWMIFVFAGINLLGNYARVDLKEILPAMSLAGAFAIAPYVEKSVVDFKRALIIIWVCFSPRLLEPLVNFGRLFTGEFQFAQNYCHEPYILPDESASRQLGQWLKANTKPTETIYVAGHGSQVQAYSERLSPTIYFDVFQTKFAKQVIYHDLTQHRPDYLLIPLFPEYQKYINADLRAFTDSLAAKYYRHTGCMFNYEIYSKR